MYLEDYVKQQTENILMRLKDYPQKVLDTNGNRVYNVEMLIYGIPVAATKENLEDYANRFNATLDFSSNGNIAKISFDNIASPLLIPEVWTLCPFDNYKTEFINLMEINLQSQTELKDKKYDVDHWLNRGQIEDAKSDSIYLRLILIDASTNRSHGASHEKKATFYKEEDLHHTKDLEFMTAPQFLKAMRTKFSKGILSNRKKKEELIDFLAEHFSFPKEIAENLIDHFYEFEYNNKWGNNS